MGGRADDIAETEKNKLAILGAAFDCEMKITPVGQFILDLAVEIIARTGKISRRADGDLRFYGTLNSQDIDFSIQKQVE